MASYKESEILITGCGVSSAIGQGKSDFISALLTGQHNFSVMKRPGRQICFPSPASGEMSQRTSDFLGAEIPTLNIPETIPEQLLRTASFSAQVALATLHEAWCDAKLHDVDPGRLGLVIGGSNLQQRELVQIHQAYQNRPQFLRPTYGFSFFDTDLCGLCSDVFGIRGFSYTLGGASASGQIAILQAIQALQSGQVDVCIAMGALMDLSFWECQGFKSLGAMGSDRYADKPDQASRPFDKNRDGFIYGECCGVVVIERADVGKRNHVVPYARIIGGAMGVDGNRNPNPSCEGEVDVMQRALKQANLQPGDIDYINPHATGSVIGDETELKAISQCGIADAYINATKSLTGHGLTAAGAVEVIATILQMQRGQLHPTRNLDEPIAAFNWIKDQMVPHTIKNALTLSMGFGGMNSALCLQKC